MQEIFYGNGPFRLEKGKVVPNTMSWHNLANIVYIDTPIGLELSVAKFQRMPRELFPMAQNIVDMIFNLAYLDPSFMHRDLYISVDGYQAKVLGKVCEIMTQDPVFPFKLVFFFENLKKLERCFDKKWLSRPNNFPNGKCEFS